MGKKLRSHVFDLLYVSFAFLLIFALAAWLVFYLTESMLIRAIVLVILLAVLCITESRVLSVRTARLLSALEARLRTGSTDSLGLPAADLVADGLGGYIKSLLAYGEKKKNAEYLSYHDELTGLYNRRFFEEEFSRLDVRRNYPIALICCDVNGLKMVNDIFSHDMGDQFLINVAHKLSNECRSDDIVARIGGDEFAVIMPGTDAATAQRIIERIRAGLPDDVIMGAVVSASLGWGVKEDSGRDMEDILTEADGRMHTRKLTESGEMKRRTISNVLKSAEQVGYVQALNDRELTLLNTFAEHLSLSRIGVSALRDAYRFRNVGKAVLPSWGGSKSKLGYPELGYRILLASTDYRSCAEYVLYQNEHWDGNGSPSSLAGAQIPVISRIIPIVESLLESGSAQAVLAGSGTLYDPALVALLGNIKL